MDRRAATRISQALFASGLIAAVFIYVRIGEIDEQPLGYDPLTNKKYVHELERYGGKANVASAELMQWFNGLWHGRNLAFTVAVLSGIAAWLFWWFATMPKWDEDPPPR